MCAAARCVSIPDQTLQVAIGSEKHPFKACETRRQSQGRFPIRPKSWVKSRSVSDKRHKKPSLVQPLNYLLDMMSPKWPGILIMGGLGDRSNMAGGDMVVNEHGDQQAGSE